MNQKIYLAGGMHSKWRDRVIKDSLQSFFVPVLKPDKHYAEYGTWDVHYIKQCDIVLAYMEKDNPSGYGLSAEIGFAKALNKTVILVIEPGHEKEKYFDFLRCFADVVYDNLDSAIEYINTF